ncbi:s-adenosyl-l-methionine--l-methionine S-methyltransferase [Labrenzia sp. 011]|nr:s-adenosyl-l-methionine--l-methionine S-methyltransferase [Labrenzia sp. 011]
MPAGTSVPGSADGISPEVPDFAFDPTDPWTETFQKGLERAGLSGKRIYEVGIGTGINVAFLLRMCGVAHVSGSDLDPRLVVLAERNVRSLAPEEADMFHPVRGAVSLIDTDEARTRIAETDVIIACLPQVGDPGDGRLTAFREAQSVELPESAEEKADDHIAHYYPWAAFDQYPFNSVGLGLNEALLRRIRDHAPAAQVIMNFGCRIGTGIIFEMFEANGFRPEKLYSQIVRQDAGTDISFFVMLEKALKGTGLEKDLVCAFFADAEGASPLSASEAQTLLDRNPDTPLYHEVCVIRAVPAAA